MSTPDPAEVIASWWFATDYCSQAEPFEVPVSTSLLAALAAAGYQVTCAASLTPPTQTPTTGAAKHERPS